MEAVGEVLHTLEAINLFCSYNSKPVLRGVSLKVCSGEAVAVVGRSGSGKTTLVKCLTGLIPHRISASVKGSVLIDGKDASKMTFSDVVKRVGLVMEDYEAQIFGLTVEEDVVFGLENLGLPKEEIAQRLEWALKSFGLWKRRQSHIFELSGGLKQRLALAAAAAMKPSFLVLDNPTANLDWVGVRELADAIEHLKREGCGVVATLRKLKGLETCFDRVYRLEDGVLREQGGVEKVSCRYLANPPAQGCDSVKAIEVQNLWFRYDGDYVLRGVSLEVFEGEVLAVMGCNGSGKTTLVKHFNGLLKPTKGRVVVCGLDTIGKTPSELAKYVGFAFQDPSRHMFADTVWEEVLFGCRCLGLPSENAEKALKLMGIEELRQRDPYSLSMGEKVRVALASALAPDPRILVLDEPTTGQDEELLADLAKTLLKLRRMGKAVVVVTHDSDFASMVSDRVIVLAEGEVLAYGETAKVLSSQPLLDQAGLEPPRAEALPCVLG